MSNKKAFLLLAAAFLAAYFIPFSRGDVQNAVLEGLMLLQEYARQHVILCLVPAMFIAGAISVFVGQASVIKYFGSKANRVLAYGVASVSGTILAVCSCTILPLFAGIYMNGAGIGPATTFLYSGPAINVLAIVMTAKVIGLKLGLARALGAVVFSVLIGLAMHVRFRKDEAGRAEAAAGPAYTETDPGRPLWKTATHLFTMVALLVFLNWAKADPTVKIWYLVYRLKWGLSAVLLAAVVLMVLKWFTRDEVKAWFEATWIFAKQIIPLLFAGVLVAGFLLGRPGHEGIISDDWVGKLVGGNSLAANLFASVSGALMYFATLTEIPIIQGLLGSGMGQGPALTLLLAGPALSLPSMIVIRSVLGTKKTLAYILLVVIMATVTGMLFGIVFG